MNYVVCGPPGSGKTTWVTNRQRWGDVVVDMDELFVAVTGLPWYEKPEALVKLVLELQETALRWIERNPARFVNAWVITGGAKAAGRARLAGRLQAKVVVLETPPDECLRRIAADTRRAEKMERWSPLVYKWWREYERGGDELRVTSNESKVHDSDRVP